MTYEFFPGANTPMGFFSRFDGLLADPRLKHRVYIKGGPGCGKSTLMRRLAKTARQRGFDTAEGLCSSDPDSLDLLLIPRAGFAICDATAPHVCEPPLCGCDGAYCDLGRFYAPGICEHIFDIKSIQAANKACYTPVTHALTAAQALYRQRRSLIGDAVWPRLRDAAARMAVRLLERGTGAAVQKLFFTGVTPQGCVSRFSALEQAKTVYLLRDSYHLAGVYLGRLLELAVELGQRTVVGCSPLFPDEPAQLYFPDCGIAFVRRSSHFTPRISGTHVIDLDDMTDETADTRAETAHLQALTGQILDTAVSHLQRAKALHDELEAALHPFVDFAGINRVGTELAAALTAWLEADS